MGASTDHVRSYYESLNTGDAEAVAAPFHPDLSGDLVSFDHAARGHTTL